VSDPPIPARRPSARGPEGSALDCPAAVTLSAYMDGVLDDAARHDVEEHLSSCEDCYSVLHETAVYLEGAEREAPGAAGRRQAILKQSRWLAPVAAGLVAATAVGLWNRMRPLDYQRYVAPLVDATGEHRYISGRLAGGFRYGPEADRVRSVSPGLPERPLDLRAAAAKAIEDAHRSPTLSHRRAAAAAHLLLGDADAAVKSLEALVHEAPKDAGVHNDLAAAYLERGQSGGQGDHERALRAAATATRLKPSLAEAWFNHAVAAAALGRTQDAALAARRVRQLEGDSPWADDLDSR
jgi:tetratricopeptide (TPR) repeat protein